MGTGLVRYKDRHICENSADPDQTAPIPSASLYA